MHRSKYPVATEPGGPPGGTGVVVLGMGRSGTSAVTRMFACSGFFAGHPDELMPATQANETGHWEHLGIWRTSERILGELGGSWFDPPDPGAQLTAREWVAPLLRAEFERIDRQAEGAPVVVKDPRIGVLTELWGEIIDAHLHPIFVVRDPVEIAASLSHRDGTPMAFSLAAWELHTASLLEYLHGKITTVVPYAQVVGDPELADMIVNSALVHMRPDRRAGVVPETAHEAFEPQLHRNRSIHGEDRTYLTGHQSELWHWLSSLPAGEQLLEAPTNLRTASAGARRSVHDETDRITKLAERTDLAHELDTIRHERDELRRELADGHSRADRLAEAFAAEQQRSGELSRELKIERDRANAAESTQDKLEQILSQVRDSRSWRLTRPLRATRQALRTFL